MNRFKVKDFANYGSARSKEEIWSELELRDEEKTPEGIKRIIRQQLDLCIEQMSDQNADVDQVIHDTRVRLKKARAVLKLVRNSLDQETIKEENSCYRDAARRLSSVRDSVAMIEILHRLTERYGSELPPDPFDELRELLTSRERKQEPEKEKAVAEVRLSLTTARPRVCSWKIKGRAFAVISPGVRLAYEQGLEGYGAASRDQSAQTLHEWRKHVKTLLYQAYVVMPVWPAMLSAIAGELDKLGKQLSRHHDLAILKRNILDQSDRFENEVAPATLVALIDQWSGELRKKALRRGERLFTDTPGAFVRRLRRWWKVKHAQVN